MNGEEQLGLAEKAFANGDFAAAVEHARAALGAGLDLDVPGSERGEYWPHPETASCEVVLGMALLELGQHDEALAHLDRAVSLDRDEKRTWSNRGHLRRERGELNEALADLERALQRDPSYAYARFRRAQTLFDLKRPVEAEADLERILSVNPFDSAPFELWQRARRERGLSCDRDALPSPKNVSGLFQRAQWFVLNGQPERAVSDYDAAYSLAPLPYLLSSRSVAREKTGDLAGAIADAEAYLASDPSNASMQSWLATLLARANG